MTSDQGWEAAPCTFLVFVDGASNGIQGAWSVAVVATDGWSQSLVGCAYGKVHTCPSSGKWYGAQDDSNIAAEFTALLVAQNWIFKRNDSARYIILPDLFLSKMMAEHSQVCKAHPRLAQLVRLYSEWIEDRCTYTHVRGHQSFAWNELADSIAGFALTHDAESQEPAIDDLHHLATAHFDLEWAWMQDQTTAIAKCFPPLLDEQVASINPSMRRVSYEVQDKEDSCDISVLKLAAVTANVLALNPANEELSVGRENFARTIRLDQQWDELQIALAGLQETRTPQGKFQSHHYNILASGADFSHTATHGCELWIHKTLAVLWKPDGTPIKLADCPCVVQCADPRRMFVRFDLGGNACTVVVLHAPYVGNRISVADMTDWWDKTEELFDRYVDTQLVMVLLDANAPLASDENDNIGLAGKESMNEAGHRFEQFILSRQLFAPTTMDWSHVGQHTTWTHPRGSKLRRDYILASQAMLAMTKMTKVLHQHDNTFTHDDHLPVLIKCEGWLEAAVTKDKVKWDFERMKDPEACRAFQKALETLPLPTWSVQVDDHCKILEAQFLKLGKQFFERKSKAKNRPQLTEATLNAIAFKRSCLDWGRQNSMMLDTEFRAELKMIEKQVRKMVWSDTRQFFQNLLVQIDEAAGLADFRAVYNTLARFGSKKAKRAGGVRPLPILQKEDGTFAKTFLEQQSIWQKQFAQVEAGEVMHWQSLLRMHSRGVGLAAGSHELQSFRRAWQFGPSREARHQDPMAFQLI